MAKAYSYTCNEKKLRDSLGACNSDKQILLSFDDGPHLDYTPKVLDALSNQNVKASFFISTHHLEKGNLNLKKKVLTRILNDGHAIGSHTHEHKAHDLRCIDSENCQYELSENESRSQIEKSRKLLMDFTNGDFAKQDHNLLRFPYGRGISPSKKEIAIMQSNGRNINGNDYREQLKFYRSFSQPMSRASEFGFSHLGWNFDSKDTGKEIKRSEYIDQNLKQFCSHKGKNIVTLFHDVKRINILENNSGITAIEEIIAKAKCLGFSFVDQNKMLKESFGLGVYTPKFRVKDQARPFLEAVEKKFSSMEELLNGIGLCRDCNDNNEQSYEKCYSQVYKDYFDHCELRSPNQKSFCLDGVWITSRWGHDQACSGKKTVEVILKSLKKR